eukprot:gnl/TRDRNA2_/TRDRNA2_159526_c1_seq2.p1 gnl/TRDRNA2_/TRDRNA2_159526_c1~~gnl/TRDRNA2_/TRDRNA2_159526_c1_seq2.p1  ORF type:complete len:204 (+),score=51.28 gnl/TRDRNA2_/TRDRNA2_159526_c1_seq2:244-855(+)
MGGAAAIEAAACSRNRAEFVCGVVTLAAQSAGAQSIRDLKLPMLIMHGTGDDILPATIAEQLAKMHPLQTSAGSGAQVMLIKHARHRLEDPQVAYAVVHFVGRVLKLSQSGAAMVDTLLKQRLAGDGELAKGIRVELLKPQAGKPSLGVIQSLEYEQGRAESPRFVVRLAAANGEDYFVMGGASEDGQTVRVRPCDLKAAPAS